MGFNTDYVQYMDLCDAGTTDYVSFPDDNPETYNYHDPGENKVQRMYRRVLSCYRNATSPQDIPDFNANCSDLYNPVLAAQRTCYSDIDCADNTKNKLCDESVRKCIQCEVDDHCGESERCNSENTCEIVLM